MRSATVRYADPAEMELVSVTTVPAHRPLPLARLGRSLPELPASHIAVVRVRGFGRYAADDVREVSVGIGLDGTIREAVLAASRDDAERFYAGD